MDIQSFLADLINEAKKSANNAYAPYSNFIVGAALLTSKGSIYSGCNVEFSDYLALHAEINALGSAVNNGESNIVAVVVYSKCSPPVLPCGSCRQKLSEFAAFHNHDIKVIAINDENEQISYWLSDLLPHSSIPVNKK